MRKENDYYFIKECIDDFILKLVCDNGKNLIVNEEALDLLIEQMEDLL